MSSQQTEMWAGIEKDSDIPMLHGHFGPRTFRHQDTSAPFDVGAEVSGQCGTGAKLE